MASLTGWLHDLATRRQREYEALLLELAQTPALLRTADDCAPPADDSWLMSSIELKCGVRISEMPVDTLPGDLQDALLRPRR